MVGKTLSVWGTKASPRRIRFWTDSCVMSRPSRVTDPAEGLSMPSSTFMAVDLPAPFGPTITASSPFFTSTVHWFNMGTL